MRGVAAAGLAAIFMAILAACAQKAEVRMIDGVRPPGKPISFAELDGWARDDQGAALKAFLVSCDRVRAPSEEKPVWRNTCDQARRTDPAEARAFFETWFTPSVVGVNDGGLFTGYFEPELLGARQRDDLHRHPIYRKPDDLVRDQSGSRARRLSDGRTVSPYYSRADIARGALADRGLELFWMQDPVEAFFLEIQGSGRVKLPGGDVARVNYHDQNGHGYTAIGRVLVQEEEMTVEEASAESIKSWLRRNPDQAQRVMNANRSYVFFRELVDLDPSLGPLGAMEAPLTAGRSIAVDRDYYPLGAPVWVETVTPEGPWNRLMVAQDVGGAIRGPQRGDLYFGTGAEAGRIAGEMRQPGRIVVLTPKEAPLVVASNQ